MSVTPDFIGQRYKDTNTGNIWIANSTTPGDWTLEVQNMLFKWNPTGVALGELLAIYAQLGLAGITNLTFEGTTINDTIDLEGSTSLVSASFPNLVSVDPLNLATRDFVIYNCSVLATINLPLLASVAGIFYAHTLPVLSSLSLPQLVSVGGTFDCQSSANVTTLSFPNYLPTNTKNQTFSGCALTLASVNHILGRCVANAAYVSGTINISGGTNAAPPTGPGTDHNILEARGVVIIHN